LVAPLVVRYFLFTRNDYNLSVSFYFSPRNWQSQLLKSSNRATQSASLKSSDPLGINLPVKKASATFGASLSLCCNGEFTEAAS